MSIFYLMAILSNFFVHFRLFACQYNVENYFHLEQKSKFSRSLVVLGCMAFHEYRFIGRIVRDDLSTKWQ